jgi:trimeric autotransporter adhesin
MSQLIKPRTKQVSAARNLVNPSVPRKSLSDGGSILTGLRWRPSLILITLVLACFGLWPAPNAFGVSPPPPGGYASNTAVGNNALFSLTTGVYNTASGYQALFRDTIGSENTAAGVSALYYNVGGSYNTANGYAALVANTTGNNNTANGVNALHNNTTGSYNIALGYGAGQLLTTGNLNIDIGHPGVAAESGTIRIGSSSQTRAFIAGVWRGGAVGYDHLPVQVDSVGQLGTNNSSRRFKKAIKPMEQASEAILALKPVTFQYKSDPPSAGPQFGLIAEEVAEVDPDLVVHDADGEVYGVRYEAVNTMLLNEFLKEHRIVQELKTISTKQEATIAKQQKQIEALAAGLQKVSDQLQLSKSAPQMAGNGR